jgi:excisionase family DNA binding protein
VAQVYIRLVYPIEDLAAAFGVPLALVRREIREGRLPAFRIGRLTRIAGEDAIEWRDRYRLAGECARAAA